MKRRAVFGWMVGAGLIVTAAGDGEVLRVGPGLAFARIEAALEVAQPGDTIGVYPPKDGGFYRQVALHVRKPRITIKGVGKKRIRLDGEGFDYSGRGAVPRAIVQFGPEADGGRLQGFELTGAHNASHNGAGVRINQANQVGILHCTIHGNDMGIMSNGSGKPGSAEGQRIEGCLIHSNGDRTDPGFNHNLYLGGSEVMMRGCEVHSSLTGHNVKSRAHRNVIVGCYIHDSANRELDLVDGRGDTDRPGSDTVMFGNVIVKDPKCPGNRGVIHFGQDGGKGHDGTLRMMHNTIVTPFVSPVVQLSAPRAKLAMVNNLVWDGASGQRNQVLVKGGRAGALSGTHNWVAAGFGTKVEGLRELMTGKRGEEPGFRDAGKRDFRLRKGAVVIDRGVAMREDLLEGLGVGSEYRDPQAVVGRAWRGSPDPGAFEWGE